MRALVLGAGLQGSACAFDLLDTTDARVTLTDCRLDAVAPFLAPFVGTRLALRRADVADEAAVRDVMVGHDAVLCALPYYFNYPMARLAVEAGLPFADLGGNTEIVRRQETLHEQATARGISVIPDCGLAPGLANVLAAEGIRRLDRADTVKLFVGGLPREPQPPLNYQVVYSLEGVLDYYTTPSWVIRDGRPAEVAALSEVEEVEFPEPLGTLEAFHTGGGASTMPWHYAGRVGVLEYKTLRYSGHAHLVSAIRDLGLLDVDALRVGGVSVRPRDVFMAVVDPKLRKPDSPDLVALMVTVQGERGGRPARVGFRLVDAFDPARGISAMMRTTGFSLSLTAQMQVDGRVTARGVHPAYLAVPFEPYVGELKRRGVVVQELE